MCDLQELLGKLKKSSAESVDNEKEFSEFKEYMHVERVVQNDLEKVINSAKISKKKSLILVCGNVGDGKSHLISYLKNKKNMLNDFIIHNDATESYGRNQTEKQALAKVISEFSDENINNDNNIKIIVAINLGVLSNFIYSTEGEKFTILRDYVECNKILTDNSISTSCDGEIIRHVNFGDYHLYRLKEDGVDSPYISNIINKIVSDVKQNIFYRAYKKCSSCPKSKFCALKLNYEMLGNEKVKQGLIDVLLETIIKDKLIISTRELLNFVYDILVHPDFNSDKTYKSFDIDYTLPSILFNHEDVSDLLSRIRKYDLINIRGEKNDELVTRFYNTKDIKKIYSEYIFENPCLSKLLEVNLNALGKEKCLLYFFRLMKLCPKKDEKILSKDNYTEFLRNLYYSNVNNTKKLKDLYKVIINCVYAWTGSGDKTNIILSVVDDKYYISTPLNFVPNIPADNNVKSISEIDRFSDNIVLNFRTENPDNEDINLTVDYELYEMLIKIKEGYNLTAKDKNYYATFLTFVNKLVSHSKYKSEIYISYLGTDGLKKYKFFDNPGFGVDFIEV